MRTLRTGSDGAQDQNELHHHHAHGVPYLGDQQIGGYTP